MARPLPKPAPHPSPPSPATSPPSAAASWSWPGSRTPSSPATSAAVWRPGLWTMFDSCQNPLQRHTTPASSILVKHRSRVWSRLAPSYTTTFPGWQSAPTTGTVTAGVSSYIFTHIELSKNKSIHIWNYRKNADLCFCHHGRCSNIKWECHTASECKAHQKCKDKKCVCVGKFEVYILKTMWYLHNGREHLRVRVWHKRGLWRPEPPVSPTEGIPVRVSYETFFTTKSNHLPSLPGIHG